MSESVSPPRRDGAKQLLGFVPYLLGYHPTDALVAVFNQADRSTRHTVCLPLHEPAEALLEHLTLRMPTRTLTGVVLIGYGPAAAGQKVTAVSKVLNLMLPVLGQFLYGDGVLSCLTLHCSCPASSGLRVDPRDTRIAAELAVAGRVALPSPQALHAQVAANPVAQAQTQAALDALEDGFRATWADVTSLMVPAQIGEQLTAGQAARLCVALRDRDVFVNVWHDTVGRMWQRDLWLDLTRRVPDAYVAAPANLATWCAWRRGKDALAAAAHDRARSVAPGDGFTRLIGLILGGRLPAHRIPWPPADDPDAPPSRNRS
jgi:hypothetical protein